MCLHVQVGAATSEVLTRPDGTKGEVWSVPISSCAHARKGTDARGAACLVVDCTVHPESVAQARARPRVHQMLVETCLEQAGRVAGVPLAKAASLPKLRFKATPEQPEKPALTVRSRTCRTTD